MRKHVLKVFGEAEGVGGCRKQREDRVKRIFCADRRAVAGREALKERGGKIERAVARPIVANRKGIAAIGTPEGVPIRQESMTPDGRAGSGATWQAV
jgi:hypothetical protein